jgi:hypothetical protein
VAIPRASLTAPRERRAQPTDEAARKHGGLQPLDFLALCPLSRPNTPLRKKQDYQFIGNAKRGWPLCEGDVSASQ